MNNIPYFNNRMDGVEIAESLLYKDFEKTCGNISKSFSRLSNYIHKTATFRDSGVDSCFVNSEIFGLESCNDDSFSQIYSNDCSQKHLMNSNSVDQNLHDRFIFNNSAVTLSATSSDKSFQANEDLVVDHLMCSNSHFRPISPDIFLKSNKLKESKQSSENILLELNSDIDNSSKISNVEVNNWICLSTSHSDSNENKSSVENTNMNSVFKLYSQSILQNKNTFVESNDSLNYKNQLSNFYAQNLLNKIKLEESMPLRTDTLCDSRCFMNINKTSHILPKPHNWDHLAENKDKNSDKQEIEKTSNTASQNIFSIQNETESLKTVLATTSYAVPTITIPRGSYIFIPLTTHNYYLNDSNKQNSKTIDLSNMPIISNSTNSLNKLIIGCYPIMNHLTDQKTSNISLPQMTTVKQSVNDKGEVYNITIKNQKAKTFRLQNDSSILTSIKTISKRLESGEFNHYLENINESHKMLIKEKNRISMDKNFFKDEKSKTIINVNNYEETKIEKELNSIINSLFEINVLISKIEAIRGMSFVEPFYKMIQKSTELIQNFQLENCEESYSRNSDVNRPNEPEVENHIPNLKQLYNDLEKFRNFLWAAYTNLNFDQQRQLSISLNKLKSWTENKANLKNIFKFKDASIKYQLPTCTPDSFISCQSFIQNSTKSTIKLENNSHALPKHPFKIPVSRYSQISNCMATILHGYSNPLPLNSTQFSYFQSPLSNFSHQQLLNSNKFSLGSNCRLSYGPQQQIYTATPILARTQTSISPRNFLIAQSSLMTPIIYQNNPRQLQLNNGSLNYMVYNSNPPII